MKVGHGSHRVKGRRRAQPMAEINIIPLVDVTLVLLIIFMTTTAFVKEAGLPMTLPSAKSAQASPEVLKDITVALTRDGKIYLDGNLANLQIVQATLQSRAQRSHDIKVIVKGDENIPYRRVVQIIDLANEAQLPVTLSANLLDNQPVIAKP